MPSGGGIEIVKGKVRIHSFIDQDLFRTYHVAQIGDSIVKKKKKETDPCPNGTALSIEISSKPHM